MADVENNKTAMCKIMNVIRVVALDDHPLIRMALQYGLANEEGIALIGLYENRKEAMRALVDLDVDVLVLDYLLGDDEMDGLYLVKHLCNRFPRLNILVSSALESPAIVQLILKAGVRGFIGKSQQHKMLVNAIRAVGSGKRFLTPDMQHELDKLQEPDKEMQAYIETRHVGEDVYLLTRELSPRESEVVRCYLNGMTIMQIAAKYSRSRKTISGQKQSALRKLGLRSDLELFKFFSGEQNIASFLEYP